MVLVVGVHPMPIDELDTTVKVGATFVPNTRIVIELVLQPVNVLVTIKLYVPFIFTETLALLALPIIPGPDHV